jgi:hypothetical protein
MKLKGAVLLLVFLSSCIFARFEAIFKSCGYGTMAGAGLGLASLVFEKKPNESYGNIPRGASLGLYGGIAYGLFAMNTPAAKNDNDIVDLPSNKLFVYPTAMEKSKLSTSLDFKKDQPTERNSQRLAGGA